MDMSFQHVNPPSQISVGMMHSHGLSSLDFSADHNVVPLHKRQPFQPLRQLLALSTQTCSPRTNH